VHQDWPTLQGSLDTVTVWMPFVDVDSNLFTMDIIPGSHTKGLFPSTRTENSFEVKPECFDEKDFVPMQTKRGDVVFMSSFAIHRSSLKGDNRLRVATSWRYENAAEPHFIERSYPFAQKRTVVADLITAGFPSAEQVREIFE
jgi:ectoine hydroxylase-related dioxygenase (phytanoyl-CoA dioxygenase family)